MSNTDTLRQTSSAAGEVLSPPLTMLPKCNNLDSSVVELEQQLDSMADCIAQTFEELHWLRSLAGLLSGCDASQPLETVAAGLLEELKDVLRATAVILLPAPPAKTDVLAPAAPIWAGDRLLDLAEVRDIVRQVSLASITRAVVYNSSSVLKSVRLQTTAQNVIVAPLNQGDQCYGWLLALNKMALSAEAKAARPDAAEFGSHEAELMNTAASMLAGHARNAQLFRAQNELRLGVIETITGALDARDPYTCGHSRRVAEYSSGIAEKLGIPPQERERIFVTGLLHDIGKIGIPDEILRKPGRLTDEEFRIIQRHPSIGHAILKPLTGLSFVLPGVLHHHERMDGRGYPQGLSGEAIPLEARILAVADSFDAMTSSRAYREAMPAEKALSILQTHAGTQWDERIVGAFVAIATSLAADSAEAGQQPR